MCALFEKKKSEQKPRKSESNENEKGRTESDKTS